MSTAKSSKLQSRFTFAVILCIAIVLGLIGIIPAEVAKKSAEPASPAAMKYKDYNVVFVSFDALQAAHVGSLGYPRDVTPTLDAMAQKASTSRTTFPLRRGPCRRR